MEWNSRQIKSNQTDIHPNLKKIVRKHLQTEFQKSYHPGNVKIMNSLLPEIRQAHAVILDAGCGVGKSSIRIALENPHALVIGVDKSLHRLSKNKAYLEGIETPANLRLIRGDLVDIWRILEDADIRLEKHFILYPNPWPKSQHLQRRWHAHAVFPAIIRLGGQLILRTNWEIYAREFADAVQIATGKRPALYQYFPGTFISPFEKKYFLSGHTLYEVKIHLSN
jgi:tRNA (guanine-N7-)-methyltransferase